MTWQGGDVTFAWPWLAIALTALVVVFLLVWRRTWWQRGHGEAAYVAHVARLRSLPRFQALVRRRVSFGLALSLMALVAAAGAIVLAGRLQERQSMAQDDRTRDIMLCLDSSGSMAEVDAAVLREFKTIVQGLQGERIGLTIWSGVAVTIFPLTDDYEYVQEQLTEAEKSFSTGDVYSDEYAIYTAGTVIDWGVQSQMGDGLASCVQRFDRRDEDRSRAIVLASDNEPLGAGIYSVPEAAEFAADEDVIVHGIAAPLTAKRPSALSQFETAATSTGGTFALLGQDGSTAAVVEAIGRLEAKKIDKPPLIQVLDRPALGTIIAGVGVGGLVVVWLLEGAVALRGRRRDGAR